MPDHLLSLKPWWPYRTAIALRFGIGSWDAFIDRIHAGEVFNSPGWEKAHKLTKHWHQARLDLGLVILVEKGSAKVGLPSSFDSQQLRPELKIEEGIYDASGGFFLHAIGGTGPFARQPEQKYHDLTVVRIQMASLLAILSVATLVFSILLIIVPPISFLLLIMSIWAGGMSWLQFSDIVADRTGVRPKWSMRNPKVAKWIPLSLFGRDRDAK